MSDILKYIADNWAAWLIMAGVEGVTLTGIAIAVIKIIAKKVGSHADSKQINDLVTVIKLLQNKLNLINTAVVALIDTTGSETAKAKYAKAQAEALAIENELTTYLDELIDVIKSKVAATLPVLKKVEIDTNATAF